MGRWAKRGGDVQREPRHRKLEQGGEHKAFVCPVFCQTPVIRNAVGVCAITARGLSNEMRHAQ